MQAGGADGPEDTFAEADEWDEPDPDWIGFFSEAELYAENSHSYRDLAYVAGRSPTYASLAEPLMRRAVELFGREGGEHQRSYALNLIGMATVHLLQSEPEQSTVLATDAIKAAKKVRSERVNTRIRKTVDTAVRDFGGLAEVVELGERLRDRAARDRGRGLTPPSHPLGPGRAGPPELPDSAPPCQVMRRPAAAGRVSPRPRLTAVHRRSRHDNDRRCPVPAVHRPVTRRVPRHGGETTRGFHRNGAARISWRITGPPLNPPKLRPHGAVPTTRRRRWHQPSPWPQTRPTLSAANTGFMLICSALVMLMTPGLAFFYGGMVRVKEHAEHADDELHQPGDRHRPVGAVRLLHGVRHRPGSVIGWNSDWVGLSDIGLTELWDGYTIPVFVFLVFQLMFAVLTPALISGALADRVKFTAWALFVALWATVVYFPVAHWVWGAGGWAFELGVIDFAGGTAVHINAGAAALGVILVIGKRIGFKKDPMRPHSLPLVMLAPRCCGSAGSASTPAPGSATTTASAR
ncbi:hypothetical protein GCM10023238_18040 [Streptomyces heliomycini]